MVSSSESRYREGDEPVPGYWLVRPLGRGNFGEVWEAVGPGSIHVALKIVQLGDRQSEKELNALRLMRNIRHSNLVPLFGFWVKNACGDFMAGSGTAEAKGSVKVQDMPTQTYRPEKHMPSELFIAMQLGDKSLYQRLYECRGECLPGIPAAELLEYMLASAKALDYLNSETNGLGKAVQHCDVKPQNIMLVGGSPQVCDYGLARLSCDARATTSIFGSLAYAAPECISGTAPSASIHTDQYSLAITYIELRTGQLPYASEDFYEILANVREGKLKFPELLSPAEVAVLRRATSLKPSKRYPSSAAMVLDLIHAQDKPAPLGIGGWIAKHPIAAAMPVVLTTALAIGWALWDPDTTEAEPKNNTLVAENTPPVTPKLGAVAGSNVITPVVVQPNITPPVKETPPKESPKIDTPPANQPPLANNSTSVSTPPAKMTEPPKNPEPIKNTEPPKTSEPKTTPPSVTPPMVEPSKNNEPSKNVEPKLSTGPKTTPPNMEPPPKVAVTKVEPPKVEPAKVDPPKVEPPKYTAPKLAPPKDPGIEIARQKVTEARGLLKQRKYDEALRAADAALAADPKSTDAKGTRADSLAGRAQNFAAVSRWNETIADYSAAIQTLPSAAIYTQRGAAYMERNGSNDPQTALDDFAMAIQLDPRCTDAFALRGAAYLSRGQFEAAINDLTRAIEINAETPGAAYKAGPVHNLRAIAERSAGKADLASLDDQIAALLDRLDQAPSDKNLQDMLATLQSKYADLRGK